MKIIISGPSGVGKSAVLQLVRDRRKDIRFSISATTRKPRPEESHRDYIFMSEDEFEDAIRNNAMAEWVNEGGFFYGTPKSQLTGEDSIILDIDTAGGMAVKRLFPSDTVLIFITAPEWVVSQRLIAREAGRMDQETIQARLGRYQHENEAATFYYDYIIPNTGTLEECADRVLRIIDSYI
jgi:guanylate kinase